jgi:hypothetical protein
MSSRTIEVSNNLLDGGDAGDDRRIMEGNSLHIVRIQKEVEDVHSSGIHGACNKTLSESHRG